MITEAVANLWDNACCPCLKLDGAGAPDARGMYAVQSRHHAQRVSVNVRAASVQLSCSPGSIEASKEGQIPCMGIGFHVLLSLWFPLSPF